MTDYVKMTSLHMIGHMVTVAVIATLVKQLMQLRFNLHDLKVEICDQQTDTEEFRNTFCDKNSKHASEGGTLKTSEAKTETNTKTKSREKTKSEDKSELHTSTKTEIDKSAKLGETQGETVSSENNTANKFQADTELEVHSGFESDENNDMCTETETHETNKGSLESAVWCQEGGLCHFHNLCYNSKEDDLFIIVGNESWFENVNFVDGSILIDLSSVRDHNAHQKYVGSFSVENSGKLDITWRYQTVLLFNRFKPDNLMHVLHDDILPMYNTLKLIAMSPDSKQIHDTDIFDVQLVFFDGWDLGDFSELYQLFSVNQVLTKNELKSEERITCFSSAYTGVSKSTTWYDYGFHKPQGPIGNYKATGKHIHALSKYILDHVHSNDDIAHPSTEYLVLLTRKQNRKILNEGQLTMEIVQKLGIKVINLNFEMFEFSKVVYLVHNSKGIIGMHGSLLSLAIFLKPGSILVELFPYAVNPSNYTPFKTLANIEGMGLIYKAWRNTNLEGSVGHPDNPPEEGGLFHLSEEERTDIMAQKEVPLHLCCSDPSWLYHIYQDTLIDIAEVLPLVESSLKESDKYFHQSELQLHPSQVKNVSCAMSKETASGKTTKITTTLLINWNLPWTIEHLEKSALHFEILVQDMNTRTKVESYVADNPPFTVGMEDESLYFVWVKCVVNRTLSGPHADAVQCIDVD